MRTHHQAVENMLDQHGVRISHRGEIVSLVPLVQQPNQGQQLLFLLIGQRKFSLRQKFIQSLFQHL